MIKLEFSCATKCRCAYDLHEFLSQSYLLLCIASAKAIHSTRRWTSILWGANHNEQYSGGLWWYVTIDLKIMSAGSIIWTLILEKLHLSVMYWCDWMTHWRDSCIILYCADDWLEKNDVRMQADSHPEMHALMIHKPNRFAGHNDMLSWRIHHLLCVLNSNENPAPSATLCQSAKHTGLHDHGHLELLEKRSKEWYKCQSNLLFYLQ